MPHASLARGYPLPPATTSTQDKDRVKKEKKYMRTKALWFLLIMTVSLTLTLACGAADEPAAESPGPPSPGVAQTTDAMTPAGSSESAGGAAGAETTGTSSPMTDNSSMPLTANPAAGTQEASANEPTATAQEVPMPTEAAEMTKPAAAESPAEPAVPATPVKAQFDDSRTLAEIYQEVGLEQFHLAECTDQPHCVPDQRTLSLGYPTRVFQSNASKGDMNVNHPFQHTIAELDFVVRNAPEHAISYSYDLHNGQRGLTNSPVGLSAFLAAPWFEPLNPEARIGERDPDAPYGDTNVYCPCHFGEGSLKTNLLNAVVKVITKNLTPEAQFFPIMQETGLIPENLRDHLSFGYRFGMSDYMERRWRQPPSNTIPNLAPGSQANFIHPELPILQVVSSVTTRLPYSLDPENQSIKELPQASITLVFNLALQRRWDTFDDPRRDIIQYAAAYLDYPKPLYRNQRGQERGELDPALDDLYPNYWHPTDYMHHSILGPVAVIISYGRDGVVVKDGTYWVDLPTTKWAADPSAGSPETARIGERPIFDSENDGWPLPGHKAISTEAAHYTRRPR